MGKPSLTDGNSFALKECCEHWRREIHEAIEAGKTVIAYLPDLQQVFVDSGQRTTLEPGEIKGRLGMSKNTTTTDRYPIPSKPVIATGSADDVATAWRMNF